VLLTIVAAPSGQTPQPFPRPSTAPPSEATTPEQTAPPSEATTQEQTAPPSEATAPEQTAPPSQTPTAEAPQASPTGLVQTDPQIPTEAILGFPIYPTAKFIASYDAGLAQRYYVFGTTAPYTSLISYYRTLLDERGDQIFDEPPTYMFEVGRFRNETMAFPPGVTIKDWTWNSEGYPNPTPGAEPERFPSIIMVVPAPPPIPE